MGVGEETLPAVGRPSHRYAEPTRRPQAHGLLGIDENLRSESAAHIGRHHAQLVLRREPDECRQDKARHVGILRGGVEREATFGTVVDRGRRARLDRIRHQPIVDEVDLDPVRGARERAIDRALVAESPLIDGVVRSLGVDLRSARRLRGGRIDDGWEFLVFDLDHLGGVARLILGLRHHDRDRITDVSHHVPGQRRIGRGPHRRAVLRMDHPAADQAADLVVRELRAGEHADHARRTARRGGVDPRDPGVGVGAADELRIGGVLHRNIIGVVALAGDETPIFLAGDSRPDAFMCHLRSPPLSAGAGLGRGRNRLDDVVIAGTAA